VHPQGTCDGHSSYFESTAVPGAAGKKGARGSSGSGACGGLLQVADRGKKAPKTSLNSYATLKPRRRAGRAKNWFSLLALPFAPIRALFGAPAALRACRGAFSAARREKGALHRPLPPPNSAPPPPGADGAWDRSCRRRARPSPQDLPAGKARSNKSTHIAQEPSTGEEPPFSASRVCLTWQTFWPAFYQ